MISYAKLCELKKLAPGDIRRIAEYAAREREYNDTIKTLFNDKSPVAFADVPSAEHVKNAETIAEGTGSVDDIARAAILRDRLDALESEKNAHLEIKETSATLRQKLTDGGVKKADVDSAWRLAKLNPTPSNIGLYSQVKRAAEAAAE